MAPIPPIFTLEIPAYKSPTHTSPAGGTFTLTLAAPHVYLLSFTSPPDNRLTPVFLQTFSLALDIILTKLPPKILITTSSIPKFYSNGLDYSAAVADPSFFQKDLYPVWRRLLTYPMPTVALINGHAFAGGLMTAMAHDYRIMNPQKGFLCLNELDFNAPLTAGMSSIFRVKIDMATFRTLVLEGKRFNAAAALEAGLVDGLGLVDEALSFVSALKLETKLRPLGKGSYGLIKEEMYREVLSDLDRDVEVEQTISQASAKDRKTRVAAYTGNADAWIKQGGNIAGNSAGDSAKAKL